MSRVVDPPRTKGGPRAGNFPGPPKNNFCPGWSHDPGQKTLLPRVVDSPVVAPLGTKGPPPFVPGEATTWDKRAFCPGWWLHPGQKGGPLYMSLNLRLPPTLEHFPDLRRAAVVSHRASCSAAVPERRPSSAASTPRPPWTTTPPGHSPVRRRPRPRATSSSPPPAIPTPPHELTAAPPKLEHW